MHINNWSTYNSTRSISDIAFYEEINRFRWNENLNSKRKENGANERHIFKVVCPIVLIIIILGLLSLFLVPLVQAALSSNTTNCASKEFWNGTSCVSKKLYQEQCNSSIECDDTKKLNCPTIPGQCNCPNISTSYKCDCLSDYFWDFTTNECSPRRSYGESCVFDYQCLPNRNLFCNGVCTCSLTLLWNGYLCDLNFFRFFTYTSAVKSIRNCGNYILSGARSIEPGSSLNYVMDAGNDSIVIYDSDWNCYSVISILKPRYMKIVENDFYVSTDYGLKKFDSNFNNLITLNTSWNYRRLQYESSNDHMIINNVIERKIETFDRNLNLLDSFNVKSFNYSQSAAGFFLFKDYWFIGTESSQVLKVKNKTIESVFQNICAVKSPVNICVDNYDNMVVACNNDKKLYLYNVNGTYLNLYLNTTSSPNYLSYDSKGRVVATGGGSVDIYS